MSLKKTKKIKTKISKTKVSKKKNKSNKENLFLVTSRLNVPQRKYCKCLMSVRKTQKNPYPICVHSLRKSNLVNYTLKSTKNVKNQFNPSQTNCVLNYDLTKFTLKDIQLLAKERKIPTTYLDKKKKRKPYQKNTLIHKLVTNYFKNKRNSKKNNNKSKK
jgi:hypothetical protein